MQENDLKQELTQLIQRVGLSHYGKSLRSKNLQLWRQIQESTSHLPDHVTLGERCFIVLHGEDQRTCEHGETKKFNTIDKGYRFCAGDCRCRKEEQSRKMLKHHEELGKDAMDQRVEKQRETLLREHGVENAMHLAQSKQKMVATNMRLYGCPFPAASNLVKQKVTDTNQERYGCHPSSLSETKAKVRATNQEKYGSTHTTHLARAAFLERHGCNPFCVPDIAEKARLTMLEKYGVEKAFQNPAILAKMIEDTHAKYGVASVLMLPQFQCKNTSKIGTHWLNSLGVTHREFQIDYDGGYIKVDGYDPDSKTVYEFYGDYHHGNPAKFAPDATHRNGKPMGLLYEATMIREELIRQLGFNLVIKWEADWKAQCRSPKRAA